MRISMDKESKLKRLKQSNLTLIFMTKYQRVWLIIANIAIMIRDEVNVSQQLFKRSMFRVLSCNYATEGPAWNSWNKFGYNRVKAIDKLIGRIWYGNLFLLTWKTSDVWTQKDACTRPQTFWFGD